MATLESIRERKKLLIGAILFALLAFVVGDAITNIPSLRNGKNDIGSVEGTEMSAMDFQKQVSLVSNVFKSTGQNLDDATTRDLAWDQFVESEVLKKEAQEIGMSVTPSELKEATLGNSVHYIMRNIPLFYNQNQQFDKNILLQVLKKIEEEEEEGIEDETGQSLKSYWLYWEKRIQESLLKEKLTKLVATAMTVPNAEVNFMAKLYGNDKKVAIVSKKYNTLADSTFIPSEADLKKEYADKKEMFKTEKFRNVKCVVFDVIPTEEDFADVSKKLNQAAEDLKTIGEQEISYFVSQESDATHPFNGFYRTANEIDYSFKDFAFSAGKGAVSQVILEENTGTYKVAKVLSDVISRADSVNVNAIAVGGTSIEDAQKRADSLIAVIKAGADFVEIAKKHSADPNGRQTGGEWGWIREGMTGSAEFDSLVFSAPKGDVVKITTPQAILIVKVNNKTTPVQKVRIAVIANKVLPSNNTHLEAFEKASNFIATNNTKEKFLQAADSLNLKVKNLDQLYENQSNLGVIDNGRPIVKWAFEAELNEVCKKPFDSKYMYDSNQMYIVCVLTDIVENGSWDEMLGKPCYIPYTNESVQNQLKSSVIKNMKAEKLMSEINPDGDLASIGKVDTVTVSMNLNGVLNNSEPALIGKIAQSDNNQTGVVKGNSGVYAFRVLNTEENVSAKINAEKLKENSYAFQSRLLQFMKKDADVNDDRSYFY